MLEVVKYYVGRICKDKKGNLTPTIIDKEIVEKIKHPTLKIPYDCPKSVAEYIFKVSIDEYFGEINYNGDCLNYGIINVGRHFEFIDEISEKLKDCDLIIISDLRRLIKRKELVEIIKKIRDIIPPNTGIYCPNALPNEVPLLTYMGVDYYDYGSCDYYGKLGYELTKNRIIKVDEKDFKDINYNIKNNKNYNIKNNNENNKDNIEDNKNIKNNINIINSNYNQLIIKNRGIMNDILKETQYAIKNNFIRNLVEETTISDPYLRGNYKRYNNILNLKSFPLSTGDKIVITIDETEIPEVKKYLNRVINYEPFSNTVVLLPCSSKKPYSKSKSHQKYIGAIKSSGVIVEELIITSPYAIVPRSLEGTINYDIPVLGIWNHNEVELINKYLKIYLKNLKNKFNEINIICHLPGHYLSMLDDMSSYGNVLITTDENGNNLSDKSLNNLKNTLKDLKENNKIKTLGNKKQAIIHNYQQLSKYQFNKVVIPDNVVIKGKRDKKFFIEENGKLEQIALLNSKNGLFVLTYYGGKLLGYKNWVSVNFKVKKGTLFAPGLKDCDENISVNDEVVIIYNNNIVGVGRSIMDGKEIKKCKYGGVVNIRHVKYE